MEKSTIIADLVARIDLIENERKTQKTQKKEDGKQVPQKTKEDEEVCPECGSNLLWVEDGIVFCKKCNEYFEYEEEKDEKEEKE